MNIVERIGIQDSRIGAIIPHSLHAIAIVGPEGGEQRIGATEHFCIFFFHHNTIFSYLTLHCIRFNFKLGLKSKVASDIVKFQHNVLVNRIQQGVHTLSIQPNRIQTRTIVRDKFILKIITTSKMQ